MEEATVKDKVRHFGGALNVFVHYGTASEKEDRRNRNFESAHLKAYLQGNKRFSFGKDAQGFPVYYPVIEDWR